MKPLLAILISISLTAAAHAQYRITWKKVGVWAAFGAAGALHGGREALHADPYVFEKKWGVDSRSFFGSDQWVRQYRQNNPDLPHRWNGLNSLRDYWHFSGLASRGLWIGGSITIGAQRRPWSHRLADLAIGYTITGVASWATYNYLRR